MTDEKHELPFSRRAFLGTSVAATITMRGGVLDDSTTQAFALEEATIDDLQARMRAGGESAVSLANKYLERIDAIDKRGPAINAVIELNPDALAMAAQLDA